MRWAKLLGVAGVVAVLGVTGVLVHRQRQRRVWTELPPDEIRARLHARLGDTPPSPSTTS